MFQRRARRMAGTIRANRRAVTAGCARLCLKRLRGSLRLQQRWRYLWLNLWPNLWTASCRDDSSWPSLPTLLSISGSAWQVDLVGLLAKRRAGIAGRHAKAIGDNQRLCTSTQHLSNHRGMTLKFIITNKCLRIYSMCVCTVCTSSFMTAT